MNRKSIFILFIALILIVIAVLLRMQRQPEPAPAPAVKQEATPVAKPEEPPTPAPRLQPTPLPEVPKLQEPVPEQTPPAMPQETPAAEEPHTRVRSDIGQLRALIEEYAEKNNGAYPTGAQALSALGTPIPKDPWQHDYYYQSPSTRNRVSYDLFSFGPDGMADTPDDDWGESGEEIVPPNE